LAAGLFIFVGTVLVCSFMLDGISVRVLDAALFHHPGKENQENLTCVGVAWAERRRAEKEMRKA
jgi:hypothetical protein